MVQHLHSQMCKPEEDDGAAHVLGSVSAWLAGVRAQRKGRLPNSVRAAYHSVHIALALSSDISD